MKLYSCSKKVEGNIFDTTGVVEVSFYKTRLFEEGEPVWKVSLWGSTYMGLERVFDNENYDEALQLFLQCLSEEIITVEFLTENSFMS